MEEEERMDNPVFIALITAIAGLLGTGIGAVIQGFNSSRLERQKFEAQLIMKALEPEDAQDRANYLKFLVNVGLVKSLVGSEIRKVAEDPESIPRSVITPRDVVSTEAAPGVIKIIEGKWKQESEKENFMISRAYESGRVLAVGHGGVLLDILDNPGKKAILKNSFKFLSGSSGNRLILFSSGHCEEVSTARNREKANKLYKILREWGYEVKEIPEDINDKNLEGAQVLVLGNAWGSVNNSEVESIKRFVTNGGGLLAAGTGWSWKYYGWKEGYRCEGDDGELKTQGQDPEDMSTYPMNRIVEPYGIWFPEDYFELPSG